MGQNEEKESADSQILDDKELDNVSGGGKFIQVSGCPRGITRLPYYSRYGIDYAECAGCANLLIGQAYGGQYCGLKLEGPVQSE